MATAKKLPSGSWRCQVFSHYETVMLPDGSTKKKRIYESFTSDDPTRAGKKEAELAAAQFAATKKKAGAERNYTLREAIDLYIQSRDSVLSKSTLHGYKNIQQTSFQSIMDKPLKSLTKIMLQDAVNAETRRKCKGTHNSKTVSPKTVKNAYGLVTAVINTYYPELDCTVKLPKIKRKIKTLPLPEVIMNAVKDTDIELAVLLSMWLSFSMSELRGLTKSKSLRGDYICIDEVVIKVGTDDIRKEEGKTYTRNRMHKIPTYIKTLIDQVDGDVIIPLTYHQLYHKFQDILEKNDIPHMTFHDLRHVNASVMAMLRIPDKYAQERGGWKTDHVMKSVYTHTFTEERMVVDETIDNYFENIMQHEMQHKKEKTP